MVIISILVMLMSSTIPADSATPLSPCPSSPNCVSSIATGNHHIEPLTISGDAGACFQRLLTVLGNRRDTTIITADDSHVQVEFRTFLGFIDDGLFVLDLPNRRIQVRSAARSGYWDFGKNRRRMEEIRGEYSR
jgi:uncharacterized protein (DUF1499 family)